MPAVLVLGVPEIDRIRSPLLKELSRSDTEALHRPGFRAPRADGFGSTEEEYVVWLAGDPEGLTTSGPVVTRPPAMLARFGTSLG